MSLVGQVHDGVILGRRVERLTNLLGEMFPPASHVLDVGSGDGKLAAELQRLRPDCRFEGIDVLVRQGTAIPVRSFDGYTIPSADKSFDAVLLVDVLHHAADAAKLLRECARVARRCVIVKDHVREGIGAEQTLRLMDWVGNAHHGVRLPYNYWSPGEWEAALAQAGLVARSWRRDLALYPPPITWLCDRSLHVLALLEPARAHWYR
ncbi:MAG TPA: class I SAM-dependent methyltransferase [Gemmatimonadaceae bacterium]|nr:class I SAM-dependent methyltransferase [Gemmatimonadaceae bacterium]